MRPSYSQRLTQWYIVLAFVPVCCAASQTVEAWPINGSKLSSPSASVSTVAARGSRTVIMLLGIFGFIPSSVAQK